MLSFIIPAYNEEELIGRTLDSVNSSLEGTFEAYEIIVVDDASTDGTISVARERGARIVSVSCRQIAATRNAGAREAKGDRLIFVDADTMVNRSVIRAAVEAMNAGAAGGGCAVNFDGTIPRYAAVLHPILTVL